MMHVYDLNSALPGRTRIAFGSFDGMHIGHQAVIGRLLGWEGQTPAVVSFSEAAAPVIYSEAEKAYLLKNRQVSLMVSLPREEMEAMTGEAFVREILVGRLQMASAVVGENVCFGADRAGVEQLRKLGAELGFDVDVVPAVCWDGKPVSAEEIRQAIAEGNFGKMTVLLGHTYIMQGTVVHGKAAGRRHGMPTANLGVAANKLFPPHGVYATLCHMDGAVYRGATNIGLRPSDDEIPIPTVETLLMDFSRDIYGRQITLEVCRYIRGVMKFANLDEVRRQIDKDMLQIAGFLDESSE